MEFVLRDIDARQCTDKISLTLVLICRCLRIGEDDMLQEVPVLFFGEHFAAARSDRAFDVAEVAVRDKRLVVSLPVEMERLVLEDLDEAERRGTDGGELRNRFVDARFVWEA